MLCEICYKEQSAFMDCAQCTKRTCAECFSNLTQLKCPFCRHVYNDKVGGEDDWLVVDEEDIEELEDAQWDNPYDHTNIILNQYRIAKRERNNDLCVDLTFDYLAQYLAGNGNLVDLTDMITQTKYINN